MQWAEGGVGWIVSAGTGLEVALIIVIVGGRGTAGLRKLATRKARTILGLGDFLDWRILVEDKYVDPCASSRSIGKEHNRWNAPQHLWMQKG